MRRRVVVTGMAGLSPLGGDWPTIRAGLLAKRSGVRVMPEWDGYEAIVGGRQNLMVAGGAEELHAVNAAVFDIMFATSKRNDEPERTPRPFDRARDGLVVGEGAGTLVLEELEHARARGARIYAEVAGFGTNGDGTHITNPDVRGMQTVMELALKDRSEERRVGKECRER